MILEDYLKRNSELYADKVAVRCGGKQLSYRQLYQSALERAAQMKTSSLHVHPRLVPFRASQSIDFLIHYFAIHLAGDAAMPLEKGISADLYLAYQKMAVSAMVPDGTADVLFTTGTTGKSKGVIISHQAIIADAENLISGQGYHHNLTFLICGPLNHIGSLSKIYPILLVGGSLVILDGMRDLNVFFQTIEEVEGRVATFLVPASISMLLTLGQRQLEQVADKIELIETGAAPIMQSSMLRLCELLPHTRLYNTYASTETGIIATYDYNKSECLAGCLGNPMWHSTITISEEGRVICGGKTLMSGYLGDDELTASILRNGKIYTNDLGRIDEQGRLRLEGRNDDILNVGGFKVNPLEVEEAALSCPEIADCVCVAFQHPVLGNVLKLLYSVKSGKDFQLPSFAKELQKKLEPYKVPKQFEKVDYIERTYNGKLNRKYYR